MFSRVGRGIGLADLSDPDREKLVSYMPGGDHWQKAIGDLSTVFQMDHIGNRVADLHLYLVEKMLNYGPRERGLAVSYTF